MSETPDQTVAPMSADPVAQLRIWADYLLAEGSYLHTQSGVQITGDLLDAVLARLAAAEARALPAPRLMLTVEDVEGLADGLYLCSVPSFHPQALRVADGRFYTCGYAYRAAEFSGRVFVGPLPDIAIPSEEAVPARPPQALDAKLSRFPWLVDDDVPSEEG